MINRLVLGTVQLGIQYGINNSLGKPESPQAMKILHEAFAAGISTLDTAKAYGNAMELIGNYHRQSKHKFKVISKFHSSSQYLLKDVQIELEQMQIEQFEAYLFHSFGDFNNASKQLFKDLGQLKEKRLIGKIGVSVYGNDQFEKALQHSEIDLIQFPYNLLDNNFQRGEMIKQAKNNGKELHVRSVFLQGLFFMNEARIPEKIKAIYPYLSRLKDIAQNEGLGMEELALAYVLQNNAIDKVLIGVDSLEQLKSNLRIVEKVSAISETLKVCIDSIHVEELDLLSPVNWN